MRLKSWVLGPGALLVLLGACTGETPKKSLPGIDVSKLTIFYPIDGVVRGRGFAEALPKDATHLRVVAVQRAKDTEAERNDDGSFSFGIQAISGDILELIPERREGREVAEEGRISYFEVPPARFSSDWVCCLPEGTCQKATDQDKGLDCPDPSTGVATMCTVDAECQRVHGRERIELLNIEVSAPDENGSVQVTGIASPGPTQIRLENRGQRAIGGHSSGARTVVLSDANGAFSFERVAATGDDEIVLQAFDLRGFNSPQGAYRVPDSPLAGLDIVGAFDFEPLTNGEVGTIAVRLSPYGADERGICPDSAEEPLLCFGGGLTYDMVNILNATIDSNPVTLVPTSTTSSLQFTRATEGDVRAGPQDIMILIDMSQAAGNIPSSERRFEFVREFIQTLRLRDRIGLGTVGGEGGEVIQEPVSDRSQVLQALSRLQNQSNSGDSSILAAVEVAAKALSGPRGRIVVIALSESDEGKMAFGDTFDEVGPNPDRGFDGYPVDLVRIGIPAQENAYVSDLVGFSGGTLTQKTGCITLLRQALSDLAGTLAGSFVLLYDVEIPETLGKQGTIEFNIEVAIEDPVRGETIRKSALYTGPVRVLNSSKEDNECPP